MTKNSTKHTTVQQFGKRSRSLRFGDFFSRFPNLRKSQPHFEGKAVTERIIDFGQNIDDYSMYVVVISSEQFGCGADPENALIFGASLHDILKRAPFTTKGRLCIPYVLHRCFSEISKKGKYRSFN